MPRFVDTNVLIYSISDDPAAADKRSTAATIFDAPDLVVSTQVLGEFSVQATRPSRDDAVTHEQARLIIESLTRYPIQPLTYDVVEAALATRERYRISYWDAAIIEAARVAGCEEVLSEDLSDGQDYGGVIVTNPFAD